MEQRIRRSEPRRRGGFTLLEIIVALGVFGVGMLSLTAMQLHAIRGGSSGRHASQAAAIAQTRMEVLQRLRWTNAALAGISFRSFRYRLEKLEIDDSKTGKS